MDYTKNQKRAIQQIDHNLQIIACAGSGKTQVVSARVVEILKRKGGQGVSPGNIVAFTFTDKAASELKDRIHHLCLQELRSEQGLAEMFVGTIHAYCLSLLQSPPLYEFLKYNVLTEVQQRLFIDRHSTESGLTDTPLLNSGDHLERWKDSRLYQQLLGILGEGDVRNRKVPPAVWEAYNKYQSLRDERRYLDYTTMIAQAVIELKKNDKLRERLSTQLKYLVVDEYQDINPLQEALIRRLHELGANICVVGDDDQTVYQWRGSDVNNIKTFGDRYSDVKQAHLNENWRSSQGIVSAARRIIEVTVDRLSKEMVSTNAQPFERGDLLALTFTTPEDEAQWISGKVKWLHGSAYRDRPDAEPRGLAYSDFAILLRSVRLDGSPILGALDEAKVPYVVIGMNGLFNTLEVDAARRCFYYLADFKPDGEPILETELRKVLRQAGFGLTSKQVANGASFLQARKGMIGQRTDASLYLQRVFLDLLEVLEIREEAIDKASGQIGRGELVFFNLGKFSQVITDYEQIHFHSVPADLYSGFASFLFHEAPSYYPEGWQEARLQKPDAVQVMTIHQAKGMQWPAVFVPCLRANRFPSKKQGGRSVWHVIPEASVTNAARYMGGLEDERRLFYVALTRAERYLFCTWAPVADNQQQRRVSPFFTELTPCDAVLTKEPKRTSLGRLKPRPRWERPSLPLTFSELKYYFECPYLFKLRFLYGFNSPVNRAIGYGKSLHDALAQIHAEAKEGRTPTLSDVPALVQEHLHLPFANEQVRMYLEKEAKEALGRYLREHGDQLRMLEHVEKVVELRLADGIVVNGRIDLIRRTDIGETVIVDFKSSERAQVEDITKRQLHLYAVGYEQLAGKRADMIEVHNLDKGGSFRELVDNDLTSQTLVLVHEAGVNLRENRLRRHSSWSPSCEQCDLTGVCRDRPAPRAA